MLSDNYTAPSFVETRNLGLPFQKTDGSVLFQTILHGIERAGRPTARRMPPGDLQPDDGDRTMDLPVRRAQDAERVSRHRLHPAHPGRRRVPPQQQQVLPEQGEHQGVIGRKAGLGLQTGLPDILARLLPPQEHLRRIRERDVSVQTLHSVRDQV